MHYIPLTETHLKLRSFLRKKAILKIEWTYWRVNNLKSRFLSWSEMVRFNRPLKPYTWDDYREKSTICWKVCWRCKKNRYEFFWSTLLGLSARNDSRTLMTAYHVSTLPCYLDWPAPVLSNSDVPVPFLSRIHILQRSKTLTWQVLPFHY